MGSPTFSNLLVRLDEELPPVVQNALREIRDLDDKIQSIMSDIRVKTHASLKNVKKCNREQRLKNYNEVQALYKEAELMAEKKIELAQKMYDRVDDYITKMDHESQRFTELQARKFEQVEKKLSNVPTPPKRSMAGQKTEKKKKPSAAEHKASRLAENAAFMEQFKPTPVCAEEMPVDPNEPVYCTCHQVSFGEMVACDNKDCPTEWFHFACVGLRDTPTGKWYCELCRQLPRKRK